MSDRTFASAVEDLAKPTGFCAAGYCPGRQPGATERSGVADVFNRGGVYVVESPGTRFCLDCAEGLAASEPA